MRYIAALIDQLSIQVLRHCFIIPLPFQLNFRSSKLKKMDFRQRPSARSRVYDEFTPPHELVQKDDEELFIINLTGFAKEQLSVQVKRRSRKVVITGERPLADGNRWCRLHKELTVPDCCNIRDVSAKFNDGVLCLSLPKLSFKSSRKEGMYEKEELSDTTEPEKRGLVAPARAMPELRLGDLKLKLGRLDFELYEVKQLAMALAGAVIAAGALGMYMHHKLAQTAER